MEDYNDPPTQWSGEIQKGTRVCCIGQSYANMDEVNIGNVGIVCDLDSDGNYRITFPSKDNWCGKPVDVAIDDIAQKIRPRDLVTVKSSITIHKFEWGNFERGMQGLLRRVRYDGIVHVQMGFDPDDRSSENNWKAQISKLEVVEDEKLHPWPGDL